MTILVYFLRTLFNYTHMLAGQLTANILMFSIMTDFLTLSKTC
jgi:hypothetical protein